jgi:hypothetical protein
LLLEKAEIKMASRRRTRDALKNCCTVLMDALSARIVAAPEEMLKIRGRKLESEG